MVKQIYPPMINEDWKIVLEHSGPYGYEPGRTHILHKAFIGWGSPYDPWVSFSNTEAKIELLIALLLQFPSTVQFLCTFCHPNRPTKASPVWDIIPITPDSLLAPVIRGDDLI